MSLLEEIIQNKKQEIRKRSKERPISGLLDQINGQEPPNCFSKAVRNDRTVQIIAEIKKASPSAGILREDFDPVAIAADYQENGAAAISVLTDERFFSGKLDYLRQIQKAIDLPLLRKDFILDPYQVIEARAFGADAILLIMTILSNSQFAELKSAAEEAGMDYLVEIHNTDELERAMTGEPGIIGINNRDLKTFEVDLSTTEKLLEIVPKEIILVSESGIQSRSDIERMGQLGLDGVLIGEALMRQEDIGPALREFVGVEKWSR